MTIPGYDAWRRQGPPEEPEPVMVPCECCDGKGWLLPNMDVIRYGGWNETAKTVSGDFLRVGGVDLGKFRDLVDAEYRRAKMLHPENPGFHMRPMWWTGSPFGAEIIALVIEVRGRGILPDCPECDGAGEVAAKPDEPDGDYEYERRRDALADRG